MPPPNEPLPNEPLGVLVGPWKVGVVFRLSELVGESYLGLGLREPKVTVLPEELYRLSYLRTSLP